MEQWLGQSEREAVIWLCPSWPQTRVIPAYHPLTDRIATLAVLNTIFIRTAFEARKWFQVDAKGRQATDPRSSEGNRSLRLHSYRRGPKHNL